MGYCDLAGISLADPHGPSRRCASRHACEHLVPREAAVVSHRAVRYGPANGAKLFCPRALRPEPCPRACMRYGGCHRFDSNNRDFSQNRSPSVMTPVVQRHPMTAVAEAAIVESKGFSWIRPFLQKYVAPKLHGVVTLNCQSTNDIGDTSQRRSIRPGFANTPTGAGGVVDETYFLELIPDPCQLLSLSQSAKLFPASARRFNSGAGFHWSPCCC